MVHDPLDVPTIPLAIPRPAVEDESPGRWIPDPGRDAGAAAWLAAAGSLAVYLILAVSGGLRDRPVVFLAGWAALAVFYVVGLTALRRARPRRGPLAFMLCAAVLFRLVLLFAPPSLAPDVHRFVRDGWVQTHGENPYANAPDDPALEILRLPDHGLIEDPSLPTATPPGAQILFALAAFVRPTPRAFKALFVALDLVLIVVLTSWLRRSDRNPLAAAVYAWHPLAVVEIAGSGHVEGAGVLLLVLATTAIIAGRRIGVALSLAASLAVTLAAAVTLPLFLRRLSFRYVALLASVLIVVAAPYVIGSNGRMAEGLQARATRAEFNGAVYPLLEDALRWLQPRGSLESAVATGRDVLHVQEGRLVISDAWYAPERLARLLVALAFAGALTAIALRNMAPEREVFAALAAFFVLSPILQPWHLLWLLPLLVLLGAGPRFREDGPAHPRRSPPPPAPVYAWSGTPWLWLSLAAPLAYSSYAATPPEAPGWLRGAEYLPMIPLALWERVAGRRGWFAEETP